MVELIELTELELELTGVNGKEYLNWYEELVKDFQQCIIFQTYPTYNLR